jgi:FkbM family methyltransferase
MKIINKYIESIFFKYFRYFLKKNNVKIIFRDELGILTERHYFDNFGYIFKTRNSCDAVPWMKALTERIKNSNVAVDIGANIGITSIWMAKNSKVVYSFEPELNNLARFRENVELNRVSNINIYDQAVSDTGGDAIITICEGYGHHSLGNIKTSKKIGEQKTKTITLDEFCTLNNIHEIDILKVDVEGFEINVFKGAKALFKEKKIKLLIFEVSLVPLKSLAKSQDEIFEFLEDMDYQVLNLDNSLVEKTKTIFHADLIAIPK